jgi:hypothetical protein
MTIELTSKIRMVSFYYLRPPYLITIKGIGNFTDLYASNTSFNSDPLLPQSGHWIYEERNYFIHLHFF